MNVIEIFKLRKNIFEEPRHVVICPLKFQQLPQWHDRSRTFSLSNGTVLTAVLKEGSVP
jgi:hypothetical protein